jgi:hypothetical protein
MKKVLLAAAVLVLASLARAVELKNARIVAADGQFLGMVTDKFQEDSVLNPFGAFGNPHEAKSIWNPFGKFGSQFEDTSAFNPRASKPPRIYIKGEREPYLLTINPLVTRRIDPNSLKPQE